MCGKRRLSDRNFNPQRGLRPPAPGCEERATWGNGRCVYQQPQRGCGHIARCLFQVRMKSVPAVTRFGVATTKITLPPRLKFLANLAFVPQIPFECAQ